MSRFLYFQEYNSRKLIDHCEHAKKAILDACPYANRCGCPVKFRVVTNETEVLLYTFDKHTPESHSANHSSRCLKLQQQDAVQAAVRMHPMASSTNVRRNLNLVDKKRQDEVYIFPAKKRTVQREVAKERRKVLSEFTSGEKIDRTEGSLTSMCEKIYIQKLVAEHNTPGGEHLQLHQSACLCYQFEKGVRFANYTTPFLLLNGADLQERISPGRHLFEDMLSNPIQFESDHPAMPIEEMVELYESYYLVEPI